MYAMEAQLNGLTDPVKQRDITTAHSKLFETWMVLTGTPKPGVRKVPRSNSRQATPFAAPVEPGTPQPVVNQPSLVLPDAQVG